MNWSEEQIEAIEKSIEHWERMIEWAKKQNAKTIASAYTMINNIGENWGDNYCSLCLISQKECDKCPLQIKFGKCEGGRKGNNWRRVDKASNWADWLIEAKIMLDQLKSLEAK